MPIRKWLLQFSIALPVAVCLLVVVQLLKGRDLEYSLEFGLSWGAASCVVFFATRIYYFRKNIYCKVCNDLPSPDDGSKEES